LVAFRVGDVYNGYRCHNHYTERDERILEVEPSIKISIFALLVSFCSLYISWKAYKRDTSDLQVSLDYWSWPEHESRFNVRTINFGRRIAFVERIKINFNKSEPLQDSIAGGHPVKEAEPFDFQLTIYHPNGIPHHTPTQVKSLEVYDTLGKCYKFPGYSIKNWIAFIRLKSQIRELWNKERPNEK
jgi:hypothetical protein